MTFDLDNLAKPAEPAPAKRGRGRPRVHADDAARQAAHRARNKETRGLVRFTVDLPQECIDGINNYMKFKGLTKTEVLEKLIRTQLMRKR